MANVKVYSTSSCVYCKMVKDLFKEKGVVYEEYDVYSNEKAREEMKKKSGQMGVPVIDIDGEIIIGFDKGRISELLGI